MDVGLRSRPSASRAASQRSISVRIASQSSIRRAAPSTKCARSIRENRSIRGGRPLLFISDRDGIPNLYRVAIQSGEIAQLTKVGTGLSGITSSSPALSVASNVGIAAFSVYEGGKYDIYTVDATERAMTLSPANENAAVLPPRDRKPSEVEELLANATFRLP